MGGIVFAGPVSATFTEGCGGGADAFDGGADRREREHG